MFCNFVNAVAVVLLCKHILFIILFIFGDINLASHCTMRPCIFKEYVECEEVAHSVSVYAWENKLGLVVGCKQELSLEKLL